MLRSSTITVGDLAPDEQRWVTWTHEGERVVRSRLDLTAASGDVETHRSLAIVPELVLRSFGPATPVAMQNSPVMLECILENPGTASLVNPIAVFLLPSGPVRRTAERLHPGETLSLSTHLSFDRQVSELRIGARVGADNIDAEQTVESTLVVGPARQIARSSGGLNAAATERSAVLENEHVRLMFPAHRVRVWAGRAARFSGQ